MGRVIFMCGPAGSGKSTVAQRYERRGMTRLSFDQEAWSRGITTMPLPLDVHRDIEGLLRARLVELVRAEADVVVDFSFWSRAMREEYREPPHRPHPPPPGPRLACLHRSSPRGRATVGQTRCR
jgi:predicted kinase